MGNIGIVKKLEEYPELNHDLVIILRDKDLMIGNILPAFSTNRVRRKHSRLIILRRQEISMERAIKKVKRKYPNSIKVFHATAANPITLLNWWRENCKNLSITKYRNRMDFGIDIDLTELDQILPDLIRKLPNASVLARQRKREKKQQQEAETTKSRAFLSRWIATGKGSPPKRRPNTPDIEVISIVSDSEVDSGTCSE